MIKHYNFFANENRGRVALVIENDVLKLVLLSGQAPLAGVLTKILVLEENLEILKRANGLALTRRNPYAIKRHLGMSGARSYRLIERRSDETMDYPTRAAVHISMYGKLNQGLRLWLGDLPPLWAAVISDEPLHYEGIEVDEVPVRNIEECEWKAPGSELLSVLEKIDGSYLDVDLVSNRDEISTEDLFFLEPEFISDLRKYIA